MYRKCTTEVSVRHQRQITESLLALMQHTAFEEITVTQLCREAGVTRRVFYHLFTGKLGALHALIDHRILALESADQDSAGQTVRFFRYWKEQKPFLDALSASGLTGLLQERMINIVLTEDYDVRYWLRRRGWGEDSQELIIFSMCGLLGLLYTWYYTGFAKSPEEMAVLTVRIAEPLLQ